MKRRILAGVLTGLCLSSSACDLVVNAGATIVAGNRGQVLGSAGDAQKGGNVAVNVLAGGSFVLDDADVFGGDDRTPKGDGSVSGPFTEAGEGIRAERATVTIQRGSVQGGEARIARGTAFAGEGITLLSSLLRVNGGRIRAGRSTAPDASPGFAILSIRSTIEMAGGTVEDDFVLNGSTLNLTAGRAGDLGLTSSTAVIRGGFVDRVLAASSPTNPRSCVEISGGEVEGPIHLGRADLFILGTGFNQPFGEVKGSGPIAIVGTLADGSPISVFVFAGTADEHVFLVQRSTLPTGPLRCAPTPAPAL